MLRLISSDGKRDVPYDHSYVYASDDGISGETAVIAVFNNIRIPLAEYGNMQRAMNALTLLGEMYMKADGNKNEEFQFPKDSEDLELPSLEEFKDLERQYLENTKLFY